LRIKILACTPYFSLSLELRGMIYKYKIGGDNGKTAKSENKKTCCSKFSIMDGVIYFGQYFTGNRVRKADL